MVIFIGICNNWIETYRISSTIRRSLINARLLINAWCKPTIYEINAGSLINTGGVAQYPHNNNRICYGDKEKSIHCNNQASGCQGGWKDVKGGSRNVGEELPVNCEYGNEHEHAVAVLNSVEGRWNCRGNCRSLTRGGSRILGRGGHSIRCCIHVILQLHAHIS